ncbi:MAG: endolytic transglycosylase MltG [Actinomycetota bacterium]
MSRRRRAGLLLAALVAVPLVLVGIGGLWYRWQLDPPGRAGAPVALRVASGWGVRDIGAELRRQGVIGSDLAFAVYARTATDGRFEAGAYRFRRDMGVRSAVRVLDAGPVRAYSELLVPPGLWMAQVARRVGATPGFDPEAVRAAVRSGAVTSRFRPAGVGSMEGLLAPDTYRVGEDEDEVDVLRSMARLFDERATALGLGRAPVRGRSAYDVVKVASLIEAEAGVEADRPLIAGVIYNRLERGMPLQIDATLIYARGDPRRRGLSDVDKAIDSPYNTYRVEGLPPTPIALVSEASLRAALAPADTDALFYVVTDRSGRHAFARTLEEHERNIADSIRRGVL